MSLQGNESKILKKEMEDIKEKVLDFESLVDYQSGSVVSRTILKKETGNITLFSFDRGQGLSEHTASFDAVVYILDGEAQVCISKDKYNLKKGQIIIMPANKPHSLKATERFKMALIMIKS